MKQSHPKVLKVKLTEGDFAGGIAGGTSHLEALECFWRGEEQLFAEEPVHS